MAASLQLACEELFFERINPFFKQYPNLPIVLAGGGALNIILNTRIKKDTGRQVFVGPDPSDCGLALGAMLGYLRPDKPYSDPCTGLPILDINTLGSTVMENVGVNSELSKYIFIDDVTKDISYVVKLISEGKIIGVIRDKSERGPRALGNRSIICSASLPHIKDTLNAKVKFREWFRPFAPMVRLEDVNKYFDWEGESRYMNFCINVRQEYQDKLQAITHVDGTARVQTITKSQNPFMHRILSDLEKLTGIGVIVNTSFNVNGRPLINTVKEAFYMLMNTELDGIIIENTLILKK
jgi:carbamoyltransferase